MPFFLYQLHLYTESRIQLSMENDIVTHMHVLSILCLYQIKNPRGGYREKEREVGGGGRMKKLIVIIHNFPRKLGMDGDRVQYQLSSIKSCRLNWKAETDNTKKTN